MTQEDFNKLISTKYDIIIFCGQPSHWQNVGEVTTKLVKKYPELKAIIITEYNSDIYKDAQYPTFTIQGLSVSFLKYFTATVLYTPFVGLHNSSKPISSKVVHSLVSLTSLDGVYADWMFDACDYILCAGPHHIQDFISLGERRNVLRGKKLVKSGYPKLDLTIKWAHQKNYSIEQLNNIETIIYAPTHVYSENQNLASIREYGESIIATILGLGFNLIFRPHPVSLTEKDSKLVEKLVSLHESNPQFQIDLSKEYQQSYSSSSLMVTDLSGTGFTFSLAYLRPTIFFAPNQNAEANLKGIQFDDRHQIGGVARNLLELKNSIQFYKSNSIENSIKSYRNNLLYNLNNSDDYISDFLYKLITGQTLYDLISIN